MLMRLQRIWKEKVVLRDMSVSTRSNLNNHSKAVRITAIKLQYKKQET